MLTEKQLSRLNTQIQAEAYVSRLYLSVSCWASSKGYSGVSTFFKNQHEEEEEHMHKLENYILATGGKVKIGAIEAPPEDFTSILEVLKMALQKEIEISENINEMVHMFFQEKNYSTFNFLQWFVSEQHQEEYLFRGLVEKAEMIGDKGNSIFWLDKEIGKTIISGQ